MSKKRTWHIEYDVHTGFDLTNAVLVGNRGLHLTDNSTTYPIPENLKITEVIPPMDDGYYISPSSGLIRRRVDGEWQHRTGSPAAWHVSTHGDDAARRQGLSRIAPLGLEDD